jgi:hypothetical protein
MLRGVALKDAPWLSLKNELSLTAIARDLKSTEVHAEPGQFYLLFPEVRR